jgi:hypothetical protein
MKYIIAAQKIMKNIIISGPKIIQCSGQPSLHHHMAFSFAASTTSMGAENPLVLIYRKTGAAATAIFGV